jgi:hypothetical protein
VRFSFGVARSPLGSPTNIPEEAKKVISEELVQSLFLSNSTQIQLEFDLLPDKPLEALFE